MELKVGGGLPPPELLPELEHPLKEMAAARIEAGIQRRVQLIERVIGVRCLAILGLF
jgi:hypothetical protein